MPYEHARFERLRGLRTSTVSSVEEVAHRAAARSVDLVFGAAFGVVGGATGRELGFGIRFGAGRAAIGEAGLVGLQLEFLAADNTGLDRKRHDANMLTKSVVEIEELGSENMEPPRIRAAY